jgi:hypothetical protein
MICPDKLMLVGNDEQRFIVINTLKDDIHYSAGNENGQERVERDGPVHEKEQAGDDDDRIYQDDHSLGGILLK